jgi:hypothetical protein
MGASTGTVHNAAGGVSRRKEVCDSHGIREPRMRLLPSDRAGLP